MQHRLANDMRYSSFPATHRVFYDKTSDAHRTGWGTTVPTDAAAGWMPGAQFTDSDAALGARIYINKGSATSCLFRQYNHLIDDEYQYYGTASDASMVWNGTNFVFATLVAHTGKFLIDNCEFNVGTLDAEMDLPTYANHGIGLYTTTDDATGSSVEPFYMKSIMTGAGGVGGRARFHMYTNVALGGWANALKAHAEFGAAGAVTGLGSALCADLELSVGTTSGTYTVLEGNLIADAAVSTGTLTSFMRFNIAGTDGAGVTTINTNGYLLDLGEGIADTTSGLIDSASITATNFTHRIRFRALGVDMWFGAHTDPDFTT